METFLREKGSEFADDFADGTFIAILAYLVDIFGHLNDVNVSLQGTAVTIIDATERINAFRSKMDLWSKRVKKRCFSTSPNSLNILLIKM